MKKKNNLIKIGSKSSFDIAQLEVTLKKGLEYIEFHTFYSDFEENNKIDFKEIKEMLKKYNVKCHAVHAPMTGECGREEVLSIGTLYEDKRSHNISVYKKCIELANFLCEHENPIVVSHIGTGYRLEDNDKNKLSKEHIDKVIEEAAEDLVDINDFISKNYPKIIFVVENMPSMVYDKNDNLVSWYFGTGVDLPKFIEKLDLSNVRSCLDICHLLSTIRVNKFKNPYSSEGIQEYIKEYSKTLGLIHLNNCIGLGEVTKIHSQPFRKEVYNDILLLKDFFESYLSLNITCPITLEINETDYATRENTGKTIDCIKHVLLLFSKTL